MTCDKFNNTPFSNGMRIETVDGLRLLIIAVDFEEKLIGVRSVETTKLTDNPLCWFRCEDCDVVIERRV
jgi:hypothetical protein